MSIFASRAGGVRQRSRRGGAAAAIVASLAIVVSVLSPLSTASADTAPTNASDPRTPETVSTDSLPVPQIGDGLSDGDSDTKGSGVVWDQVVVGDTVYVGGNFRFARPAGAAAGEKVVERSNFLAYNLKTGALLDDAPSFNAQVRTLAVSPDHKRLYVGGLFTEVEGAKRYRIAAFDVATGALVKTFAPGVSARVNTIIATNSTVYVGGVFAQVGGQERLGLASFAAADGALQPWAPSAAGGSPMSMVISPDESKIVISGSFTSLNKSSKPGWGMGAVDAKGTGTTALPWNANSVIRNAGSGSYIKSLTSDGTNVYGVGSNFGQVVDQFTEGTFAARWSDGELVWHTDCHGDTYSVAVSAGAVYTAGHAHDCSRIGTGGFAEGTTTVTSDKHHRALAFSTSATGTLRAWTGGGGYPNFAGQPSPSMLDWYPNLSPGAFTGATQAAWSVTASKGYVLLGGEFPKVNGVAQRGLARFAPKAVAPNKDRPQLEADGMKPQVDGFWGTYVKLAWPANYDRDNARLTYQVIRDGRTASPVFQTSVESRFWQRPTIRATDGHLEPGSTHTYQIRVIDPFGNARWGTKISYTAPPASSPNIQPDGLLTSYDRSVLQDQPQMYWPGNEAVVNPTQDWVLNNDMPVSSAVKSPGIESGGTGKSLTFSGTNASVARTSALFDAPTTFSIEAWFSTTAKKGGKIVGFENGNYDKHIYMDASGRVSLGVWAGAQRVLTSPTALNDGRWHHVMGTLTPAGTMELMIDGVSVGSRSDVAGSHLYQGRWVVGGGPSWADNASAASYYFSGSIDNVAIYDRAVSADVSRRHVEAAQLPKPNAIPSAAFTAAMSELAVSVDASASTDTDGKIASFAWDFGDGATASDARASHTYPAAGTYRVTLTVTDDRGGKATASKEVTVTTAPKPEAPKSASDAFDRSVASGWGVAPQGGAWKQAGSASGLSVANGAGVMTTGGGQTRTVTLPELTSTSTDSVVSFSIAEAPGSGSQYVSVIGRQVGSEAYTARVVVQSNGVLQLQVRRGATTLKAVNVSAAVYAAGKPVNVRFQVSGEGTTRLNAKVWTTGAEPAAWNVTATDTTAGLQAKGTVGVSTYVPSSAPTTTVSFLEYRVTPVG